MKHKPITMTASDFYNDPKLIENFTRSKTFESCRRLREVLPGFPSYHETVNEFHAAWLIFLMAKTGKTSTRKAFVHGILSANELKMGDVLFVHWLAELLLKPETIKKEIKSIWIYQDQNLIHITCSDRILIFQGSRKPKQVSQLCQLSPQFLYDFALKLNETLIDESAEIIFSDPDVDEDEVFTKENL